VATQLSFATPVPVGETLTRLAYELKQPFLDWLAVMGRAQPDPVIWWGSTLASRSPLQTDIFLLVCYAELVHRWIEQAAPSSSRLVVIEDPWLAVVLKRRYGHDRRVGFSGSPLRSCLLDAAVWLLRTPLTTVRTLLGSIKLMLVARVVCGRRDRLGTTGTQRAVLLYTWIEARCFPSPGTFADPWTGRLEEILSARGHQVWRLTALDIPARLLMRLRPFAERLVVTPRYVRFRDIVRSISCQFRIHRRDQVSRFGEWNLAPLLCRAQLQEWGLGRFAHYQLLYFSMCRIAERLGHKVQCLVYPFENQPWEKVSCLAWRQEAPQVRLVGYQHAWAPPLLLSYFLGAHEHEILPLPDRIVANSEFNLRLLRAGGYPPERLVNGGALRHEYLHSAAERHPNRLIERGLTRQSRGWVVLVTLPLLAPQAGSLFADLVEEFQQPLVLGGDEPPVMFIMKCHPRLPAELFYHGKVRLPAWMSFSQEPMRTVLPRTDLLLYIGPTSSWWEAWLSGVPVLKYQADLLDIDSGPTIDGGAVHTCSRDTLRFAITSLLGAAAPRQRPGPQRIEEFFGRVDEEVWTAVVTGEEPTLESHAVTAG